MFRFSALQRAENSSINIQKPLVDAHRVVSVLFSEPKIPQSTLDCLQRGIVPCFSALQRAENSSIRRSASRTGITQRVSVLFSEPKIPQFPTGGRLRRRGTGFSALQRAENSSIRARSGRRRSRHEKFQCSSASRKFLNSIVTVSNQSLLGVSVLFSEPKIPQCW